jgi:hypothetical protein
MEDAADVAFKAILDKLCALSSVKHIRFVLFDQSSLNIHEKVLKEVLEGQKKH